jgi:hypothetical protein
MALKFRKNYYKITITVLICLLLGFLYLGNYNLIEGVTNNETSAKQPDDEAAAQKIAATGGTDTTSDGYNAQYNSYKLNKMLAQKNP